MELDEFKVLSRHQQFTPVAAMSVQDIGRIIRRKAQSVLNQVVRNLRVEILFAGFFALCMAALLVIASTGYLRIFAGFMCCYAIIFIYNLYALVKKIRFLDPIPSVSDNLRQVIVILTRFKNAYFQGTLVMIPVLLGTGFVYGLTGGHDLAANLRPFLHSPVAWLYLAICIAWYAMMYVFTRWYTRNLYGRHLVSLRMQLNELEA